MLRTIRHCFDLRDESFQREREEKKRSLSFYALSGICLNSFLLCPLAISIFTIYCRVIDGIAERLCTGVFTTHCGLYNNQIDGQSRQSLKTCLETKQNKKFCADWILR